MQVGLWFKQICSFYCSLFEGSLITNDLILLKMSSYWQTAVSVSVAIVDSFSLYFAYVGHAAANTAPVKIEFSLKNEELDKYTQCYFSSLFFSFCCYNFKNLHLNFSKRVWYRLGVRIFSVLNALIGRFESLVRLISLCHLHLGRLAIFHPWPSMWVLDYLLW